jgi:predicted nucleotidyltransferase
MEGREIDLPEKYLEIIRKVLSPYREKIQKVILFGSRATGKSRPSSDIDLAIEGDLTGKDLANIKISFEESSLPVEVDVVLYNKIQSELLKKHIRRVGVEVEV